MTRRPIVLLLLPALAVALVASSTAAAQAPSPEDQLDSARERRAEIAEELDVLRASDVELKAESNRLAREQEELEARLSEADAELADIRRRNQELGAELTDAERAEAEARLAANERAVAAYMQPRDEASVRLLKARDLNEVDRITNIVAAVADHDREIIGVHVAAKRRLEGVRSELAEAEARTAELREQRAADVEGLRAARVRHAEVEEALETRIAEFQSEADALAAQESEIAALISARAEPAPVAEPAAATSTSTPSDTAPPPPTTARPSTPAAGNGTTTPPPSPTPAPTSPPTTSPPSSGRSLVWPTAGPVTSPFGPRWGRMHNGIDIGAPTGQRIVAAASGTVIFSGTMSGYGEVVLIDHGSGLVTLYAHQSQRQVSNGQRVSQGQQIGLIGSTGNSTGPHLHFETRVSGAAVDPMRYL